MSVRFFPLETKFELTHKRSLNRWVKSIVALHLFKCGDINFIFTNNDKILEVNRQFLNHDYYTDIITFNYNQHKFISGDIYISIDTVLSNAQIYHVSLHEELHRVMIHGILHLIGFNDKTKKEKEIMQQQEDICLEILHSKYLLN